MRIKKLRTSMGAEGITKAGQVIDVTDHRGRQLIERGLARALLPGEGNAQLAAPGKRGSGAVAGEVRRPVKKAAVGPLADLSTESGSRTGPAPSRSSSQAAPAQPSPELTDAEPRRKQRSRKSPASTEAGN